LAHSDKHDLLLEFAIPGCVVCEDFLPGLVDDPAYSVLKCLLEGGGSALYWFEEVVSVSVHHVVATVGCYVCHWGLGYAPCLGVVTRIVKLQAEEDDGEGELWVVVTRFPGVPITSGKSHSVSREEWAARVAPPGAHLTVYTQFSDFFFSKLHQHTVSGAYVFIPA
jgi:hypothetical protein